MIVRAFNIDMGGDCPRPYIAVAFGSSIFHHWYRIDRVKWNDPNSDYHIRYKDMDWILPPNVQSEIRKLKERFHLT